MSQPTPLPTRLFEIGTCESCGNKDWCGPTACPDDADHRHRVCHACLSLLSVEYRKDIRCWVSPRCPPVVTDAEFTFAALKETPKP